MVSDRRLDPSRAARPQAWIRPGRSPRRAPRTPNTRPSAPTIAPVMLGKKNPRGRLPGPDVEPRHARRRRAAARLAPRPATISTECGRRGAAHHRSAAAPAHHAFASPLRSPKEDRVARTIVLIHGAWMTPLCWDGFVRRYEARDIAASPRPGLRRPPRARAAPLARPGAGARRLRRADRPLCPHHRSAAGAADHHWPLDGRPGGAAAAGPRLGTAGGGNRSRAPARRPGRSSRHVVRPADRPGLGQPGGRFDRCRFGALPGSFCHTLEADEQVAAYQRQVVPTPGRLYWQLLFGRDTKVDFRNGKRAPLLITVASRTAPSMPPRSDRTTASTATPPPSPSYSSSPTEPTGSSPPPAGKRSPTPSSTGSRSGRGSRAA